MNDAELCRSRGWGKGMILESGVAPHTRRIAIIEIGEAVVFGQEIVGTNDKPIGPVTLQGAEWYPVGRQLETGPVKQ